MAEKVNECFLKNIFTKKKKDSQTLDIWVFVVFIALTYPSHSEKLRGTITYQEDKCFCIAKKNVYETFLLEKK